MMMTEKRQKRRSLNDVGFVMRNGLGKKMKKGVVNRKKKKLLSKNNKNVSSKTKKNSKRKNVWNPNKQQKQHDLLHNVMQQLNQSEMQKKQHVKQSLQQQKNNAWPKSKLPKRKMRLNAALQQTEHSMNSEPVLREKVHVPQMSKFL